ncbi:hypothetical protein, partial [Brevundimonas sp.]|uniref:hypothetical protein n=1 Tax=Brevundimonas sp. TaxID=1871086 RepID=UPI0028B1B2AA
LLFIVIHRSGQKMRQWAACPSRTALLPSCLGGMDSDCGFRSLRASMTDRLRFLAVLSPLE